MFSWCEVRELVPGARDPKYRIPGWQREPVNVLKSIQPEGVTNTEGVVREGEVPVNRLGMPDWEERRFGEDSVVLSL